MSFFMTGFFDEYKATVTVKGWQSDEHMISGRNGRREDARSGFSNEPGWTAFPMPADRHRRSAGFPGSSLSFHPVSGCIAAAKRELRLPDVFAGNRRF
jgi:hypothetical protein